MSNSSSSGSPGIAGRIFGSLFFLVFFGMGSVFFVLLGIGIWKTAVTYTWKATECSIVENSFANPEARDGKPALHVRYQYRFEGADYTSAQLSRGMTSESEDMWRLHGQLPVGTRTTCYVNPGQPGQAVLQRGSLWPALFLALPLVFMGVGAVGVIGVWRRGGAAKPAPLSSTLKAGKPRGLGVGLCSVFILMGLGFAVPFFVRPMLSVIEARAWPAVPCEIVSSRMASHSGDSTTYSVDILYRYAIAGRTYTANRYKFMGGSSSGAEGKQAIVARLPAGTHTTCYVDPADPTNAVIERGFTADMWFGLIPMVFVAFGCGGIVLTLRNRASAPAFTAKMTTGPRGATIATRSGGGVLRPATSRRAKLIGFVIVALFWNGIVFVFLFHVVDEWRRGNSPWFLTLFLTPFVAIGAGLVYAVIRQALAVFNPLPQLTLDPAEMLVGGKARLAWTVAGNVQKLQQLEIVLEGAEEATYRRGTDTKTDREVFATIPIVKLDDPARMQQGWTHLSLPAGTMHSFAAPNNKITWTLRVRGQIPKWPDIDDEYPVHVAPKLASPTA